MRKIKSTALLGAFVAVASVGVISHEAHGTTIGTPNNVTTIISKEMLPNSSAAFQASIIPSIGVNGNSNSSITLTISGASFSGGTASYSISGASCTSVTGAPTWTNSLTFNGCSVSANVSYAIVGPSSDVNYFSVSVPASSSSIVLSYKSNVGGDTSASATIAQVQQQLSFAPISDTTAYIDPSSLSYFGFGSSTSNYASNYVVLSNSEYGNNSTWSNTINVTSPHSYTMSFLFTGIPSSVSSVSAIDTGYNSSSTQIPGNASATVSFTLSNAPFTSASSDTMYFYFYNSNNVNIQTGTISLSSITGIGFNGSVSTSYVYSSTPQNFLTFAIGGTQIYVPDALAPDNNLIQSGYITISMPSSASIASISVLNNPSASCPVPTTSNGILQSTSSTGVYYIDLSKLASACTGLSASAWQSGVPLVIYISGSNANPNTITADAYATFNNMLKRIPVNVLNISSANPNANFYY